MKMRLPSYLQSQEVSQSATEMHCDELLRYAQRRLRATPRSKPTFQLYENPLRVILPCSRFSIVLLHTRYVHESVVSDESDHEMHQHENEHGIPRLSFGEDPKIGQPQSYRHENCRSKEEPPRDRGHTGNDRPGHAGNEHADHSQRCVVREPKVHETPGRWEHAGADRNQNRIAKQRGDNRDCRSDAKAKSRRLLVASGKVDPSDPEDRSSELPPICDRGTRKCTGELRFEHSPILSGCPNKEVAPFLRF